MRKSREKWDVVLNRIFTILKYGPIQYYGEADAGTWRGSGVLFDVTKWMIEQNLLVHNGEYVDITLGSVAIYIQATVEKQFEDWGEGS